MTHEELESLPEMGGLSFEERMVEGQKVRVPVLGKVGALFVGGNEPGCVLDLDGSRWMVGTFEGKRYKRRMPDL